MAETPRLQAKRKAWECGRVFATPVGAMLPAEGHATLGTEIPVLRRVVMPVIGGAMATG